MTKERVSSQRRVAIRMYLIDFFIALVVAQDSECFGYDL